MEKSQEINEEPDPSAKGKNIRIISDGTLLGTKIVDAATRVPVPGFITAISWDITLTGPSTAVITYVYPEIDAVGEDISLTEEEQKKENERIESQTEEEATEEGNRITNRERFG